MNVVVVGGGPAGLYLSLLIRKEMPDATVSVFERDPAGATYGWGVVFSDRTLASFRNADPRSYDDIAEELIVWESIDVRHRGETVRAEGQAFSAIARKRLLQVLQFRCRALGVQMHFEAEVSDLDDLPPHDLLVAADGVNSTVRERFAGRFAPSLSEGGSRYIWLGTHCTFDCFTFIFRTNEHGLFQVHAYPFDGRTSTFIVECDERTWRNAGLDRASEQESIAFCEELFDGDLRGNGLMGNRSMWLRFPTLKTKTWRAGNIVLLGDAAHTAHFSIGSGTKLAMEDSIALAGALREQGSIEAALADYEAERKPRVERFQEAARQSQAYFEDTRRYAGMEPLQFAFHLLSRSGRMDYGAIRLRDPQLVAAVDSWFARGSRSGGPRAVVPPPAHTPIALRGLTIPNRVVATMAPTYSCREGTPGASHRAASMRAAETGAGLVMTDVVAAGASGRITDGCPGLWCDAHTEAWRGILDDNPGVLFGLSLSHAGRRAATRRRGLGTDVPLADGWRPTAPSPIAYSKWSPAPVEMTSPDMNRVRDEFVTAARRAHEAGFALVEIVMSHGYLLSSFLSPLANVRDDAFGGTSANRLRFPLEVLRAVRGAWPGPLAVSLNASDWQRGGIEVDEAERIAAALAAQGCDLVHVDAGQQSDRTIPRYDPYWLTNYSDRIRNGVGIATLAASGFRVLDEIHGAIAGGRADLCLLERL